MPLNSKSRAVNQRVVIEVLQQRRRERLVDGILVPDQAYENGRLVKGRVISIGRNALSENLNVGDVVLFDKHSIFAEHGFSEGTEQKGEFVVTNVENVICLIEEEEV